MDILFGFAKNELSITQHDAREKKKDDRSPFVRAA
jgi:hypothetical protein